MNAAKCISVKQGDRCEKGYKKMTDIRFARTETSAVSERPNEMGHIPIWSKVKFIDRDPHWYTRRVKETIHIRLHPSNFNKDSCIKKKSSDMCG